MFDHRNFATQGLYPGLVTTRSIANLGHFEIQVIIEPLPSGFGGGGLLGAGYDKYRIRIIVTRKGKTWEYEKIVSSTTAKVIAKVLKKKVAEPTFSINSRVVENTDPEIKVTHVNRKTET